jgi:hypothetical protein
MVYTLWQLPNRRMGNHPSAASARHAATGLIADLPSVPTNMSLDLLDELDE